MKGLLRTRLHMGRQTIAFPDGPARFPERFRGRPVLTPGRCAEGCRACQEVCPTEAIEGAGGPGLALSLRNQAISDFPICNKSFNLSYCGFDL